MPEAQSAAVWQRLSPWALLILFGTGLVRWGRQNLPLVVGAGAGLAWVERFGWPQVIALLVLVGGGAAIASLLYYRRFRFRLEDEALVVQKGLLQRSETRIDRGRVQHVGIEQPFYMRTFDVVCLRIDTPGGGTGNVELPGISRELAEQLRRALVLDSPEPAAAHTEPPPYLYRANIRGLTLHGLASNHAYIIAAALTPFLEPLVRAARRHVHELDQLRWVGLAVEAPLLAATIGIVMLVMLLALVSVVVCWLHYWGFTLTRERNRVVQRSGLFNRQEQALALTKLQSIDWVQTAVGRLLGRGHLICRQFGGGPSESGSGSFLIPALTQGQAQAISSELWEGLTAADALQRVHPYYRRVLILRLGAAVWLATGLLSAATANPSWLLGALAASFLLVPIAHLRWRAIGWRRQGRYLQVRLGLLGHRTSLFPFERVQAVQLQESWFQRRRGLATLRLTLASGPITIPYLSRSLALKLADECLWRVEARTADVTGTSGPGGSHRA